MSVPGLNFVTPDTVTAGAKNGNAPADRTARSAAITGLAISNGSTFWIRWIDADINGFDDGLAVDDFSLTIQDSIAPALLSFTRQAPAVSPTSADTLIFRATFSEDVQNLLDATADFRVDSTTTATVMGVVAVDARTYDVTVSGGDLAAFNGTVGLNLAGGQNITDRAGNALPSGEPATDQTYILDNTSAAVSSILQQNPLASPTNLTSVTFRVVFDEDVQNVDTTDFLAAVTGTATGTISSILVQSASTYEVVLTGVGGNGVLDLNFSPGNDIADLTGNPLGASPVTGTEQTYTIDTVPPTVLFGGSTIPEQNSILLAGPARIVIQFSEDVVADGGIHAANIPGNYLLVEEGANGTFDTTACSGGLQTDDLRIAINSVAYSNGGGLFAANLNINNGVPLPAGKYRLFICGTSSIYDLAGNRLNQGADSLLNFMVGRMNALPGTGFAPNRVTSLAPQTISYTDLGSLWLEIPRLGVKMPIVGVPKTKNEWNVSWLGKNAGWLEGSAYPSWKGNSVITGHVWNADNSAGPFVYLNTLWWGDKIIVHLAGQQYIYEVRSVKQVAPTDVSAMLKHEELPWLTLISCKSYDEATDSYRYRIVVRAVLVEVK
jgi:LPXTG-site transpeptidase (sortase) family protein